MPENLIPLLIIGALAFGNWLLEQQRGKQEKRDRAERKAAKKAARKEEREEGDGLSVPAKESDEERQMRRFFEALGLPPEGGPVPPFVPPASAGKRDQRRKSDTRKASASPAAPSTPSAASPVPSRERESTPSARRSSVPSSPQSLPRTTPRPQPVRGREVEPPPISPEIQPAAAAPAAMERPKESEPIRPLSAAALEAQLAALRRTAVRSGGDAPIPVKSAYTLSEKEEWLDREALRRRLSDVKAIREAYVLREILGPPKALQP